MFNVLISTHWKLLFVCPEMIKPRPFTDINPLKSAHIWLKEITKLIIKEKY